MEAHGLHLAVYLVCPALRRQGWFSPFKTAYDVMNNWGANHGAISYGHIGADLITFCSMLRIPVAMHNVPVDKIFRPACVERVRHGQGRRGLSRVRELRPVLQKIINRKNRRGGILRRSDCQKRSRRAAFFAIIEAVMKMLKKEAEQRQAIEMLCTDMLVPQEHLLRKIDAAVDFTHIYELVEDLYCEDNGRPSCDPVVLFKLVLIQHLFGIRSLRQTMRDAEVNVAYRWFLGYTMSQNLPHFATISYAFCHRFTAEVIEGVFRWILEEVARAGYLSPEVVFVDGTHIKANANLKKRVKKEIPVAAKRYQEQLDAEIEADRAAHGKKPLKKKDDDDDSTPSRDRKRSPNRRPIRTAACFRRASIGNASPTRRIRSATGGAMCWKRRSRPAMSTTASPLTLCLSVWSSTIPRRG